MNGRGGERVTADPGRRAFLSLVAASSLAGCSGPLPGVESRTVDGRRLQELAGKDPVEVPETLPVSIEASFVDAQAARAREVLATVPAPFDREEIPNDAIRERLNRHAERAREALREVDDRPTPSERLGQAGLARADAREVQATWQAIDEDLTVEAVRGNREPIREDLEAFRSRWSYVGDDPVRALRIHAELERRVQGAHNWTTFRNPEGTIADGPFGVGEVASHLELARVDVAVATYLFDRFREALAHPRDLRRRFATARETLVDRVGDVAGALPETDEDAGPTSLVEGKPAESAALWALADIYDGARRTARDIRTEEETPTGPATAILEAGTALVYLRAFHALRSRIEKGETRPVQSASDVAALRRDAVEAVRTALEALEGGLVRELLPVFARHVGYTDAQFERLSGEVPLEEVRREARGYVLVASTCRVVPEVSRTLRSRVAP